MDAGRNDNFQTRSKETKVNKSEGGQDEYLRMDSRDSGAYSHVKAKCKMAAQHSEKILLIILRLLTVK